MPVGGTFTHPLARRSDSVSNVQSAKSMLACTWRCDDNSAGRPRGYGVV